MRALIAFLMGLFLGGLLGMFTMALLACCGRREDDSDK